MNLQVANMHSHVQSCKLLMCPVLYIVMCVHLLQVVLLFFILCCKYCIEYSSIVYINPKMSQSKSESCGDGSGTTVIFKLLYFPGGSDGKASAYSAGDPGSIPGSGRSSGEGNGNPLQYSCLELWF